MFCAHCGRVLEPETSERVYLADALQCRISVCSRCTQWLILHGYARRSAHCGRGWALTIPTDAVDHQPAQRTQRTVHDHRATLDVGTGPAVRELTGAWDDRFWTSDRLLALVRLEASLRE